jgi:hypothetical protein
MPRGWRLGPHREHELRSKPARQSSTDEGVETEPWPSHLRRRQTAEVDMLNLKPPRHALLYRTDAFAKRLANDGYLHIVCLPHHLGGRRRTHEQPLAGAVAGWMADTTRNELGRIRDMLAKAHAQYFFPTLGG